MVFTLNCRYRTDGMGAADGFGIDLAEAEVQNLSFFDQLADRFGHDFDRRTGVDAVLVEDAERLHAEVAQRVLAYTADIGGRAVLFRPDLNAIHKLMSELGRGEHTVGITF